MDGLILLGFRLDKSLKEELENNFENELTFAENITDFIEYLKNKKYEMCIRDRSTRRTGKRNWKYS